MFLFPCSEALSLLGYIYLFKIFRVIIAQLEVDVLYCFFNSLLAAYPNDWANTLFDAPARCDACHADLIPLCHFLDSLYNLLVDSVFLMLIVCSQPSSRLHSLSSTVLTRW